MSPEQAKGKPADKRSDIWAFGCVLYEMLTGVRAFDGEDITDVLGAVVRLEPSWQALPSDLSPALRTLLQSCLVKDPRHRVADISIVLFVLEKSGSLAAPIGIASIPPPPIRPVWRRALPWVLGALVAGISVLSTLVERRTPPVQVARLTRFVLTTPQGELFRSPTGAGIAVSPDGSRIVYRSTPGGIPNTTLGGLYLRPVDQFQAVALRGADSAASPLFSRDGEWIVYEDGRAGALKRAPGARRTASDDLSAGGWPTTRGELESR
jgi:serine/threonine-protein kinase